MRIPCALLLVAGGLSAAEPGDPDYEPASTLVEQYELLAGDEPDAAVDEVAYESARAEFESQVPTVVAPTPAEIREFRVDLERHWNGNLPALLRYLRRLDPEAGDNLEPPEEGAPPRWHPSADVDGLGNIIRTPREKRNQWRRRVEASLRRLARQ